MKQRSYCSVWCLFPLMVTIATLASLARLDKVKSNRNNSDAFQWADAQDSCTYEQLEAAFGDTKSQLQSPFNLELEPQDKCWNLADRILSIPQSAILNFDSLIPLGAGSKGGVFMVFLNLSDSQPPCKAVYKTDLVNTNLCAKVWTHPVSMGWYRTKSCLSAHLNPWSTSMRGELTGGVIFQAFQQYAADHPQDPLDTRGIMPAWAMVPFHYDHDDGNNNNDGSDNNNKHKHRRNGLRRGDYPGVMGMIMPYKNFVALKPHVARGLTATRLASLLHTAAQGLAYVHELGLAHQDLVASDYKNVGLVKDENNNLVHSILFDWGYTAVDDDYDKAEECALGRACDFCAASYFPKPRAGGDHGARGSRRRTLDCQNLQSMVSTLWDQVQDAETEGRYWKMQMQDAVDCSHSTQELADFLAVAAQGRSG
eukprot:scaffold1663_cov171-Amphora_coffeaeformis.AAC.20